MTPYYPTSPPAPPQRSRRGLMVALVVLGFVLMLAVALIALLLVRGTTSAVPPATATGVVLSAPTPSAPSPATTIPSAATTSAAAGGAQSKATVTATRTATTATGPQIATFAVVPQSAISGTTVTCTKAVNLAVDFRWVTTGATGVYFGVMTMDAQQAPYFSDLPASGSLGSGRTAVFPCYADAGEHTQIYTLTLTSNGQKVSRTITLTEKYVP